MSRSGIVREFSFKRINLRSLGDPTGPDGSNGGLFFRLIHPGPCKDDIHIFHFRGGYFSRGRDQMKGRVRCGAFQLWMTSSDSSSSGVRPEFLYQSNSLRKPSCRPI